MITSVPDVPELGNTNPSSVNPAKKWIFVLNNYTDKEYDEICSIILCSNNIPFALIGKETGKKCGTPHLQGYLEFKNKTRPMSVFKFTKRIHYEIARGNRDQNIDYCSKENLTFSKGLPKPIKLITNFYPWQQQIIDIINTEPDDRTIHWYWEPNGNIGKSALAKYLIVKHQALYCCGGNFRDISNLVFNQDMDKTNCVIFDIPRASKNKVSYRSLESIKNGIVTNTKYETGVKVFNPPHIICFSNFEPELSEEYLSVDRWKVTELFY